jgi:hypothetical protein
MARKIISKGTSSHSNSKRQPSTKGSSTTGNVVESNRANNFGTNCRHNSHQGNSDINRRPFKSETNLFSNTGNPCLQPQGEQKMFDEHNCHNSIVNSSNGFIPISKYDIQQNKLSHGDGPIQNRKSDGDSEVTMFKTKVLYHSRSDFRPIGLTEDQGNLTESGEKEANV